MLEVNYLKTAIEYMQRAGVQFDPGLSDAEILDIEQKCKFRFPPELRSLLQFALHISREQNGHRFDYFPNWRIEPEKEFIKSWEWVIDGILFHVRDLGFRRKGFWVDEWGARPKDVEEAVEVARKALQKVTPLVRVYAHRYMPLKPEASGNPVFSLWSTDIIYYGYNFVHYLAWEFGIPVGEYETPYPPYIDFWSEFDPPLDGREYETHYTLRWD
jgi:hypothetical protein